jgi:hypothetical protein
MTRTALLCTAALTTVAIAGIGIHAAVADAFCKPSISGATYTCFTVWVPGPVNNGNYGEGSCLVKAIMDQMPNKGPGTNSVQCTDVPQGSTSLGGSNASNGGAEAACLAMSLTSSPPGCNTNCGCTGPAAN